MTAPSLVSLLLSAMTDATLLAAARAEHQRDRGHLDLCDENERAARATFEAAVSAEREAVMPSSDEQVDLARATSRAGANLRHQRDKSARQRATAERSAAKADGALSTFRASSKRFCAAFNTWLANAETGEEPAHEPA
jgi:hypothetical protein